MCKTFVIDTNVLLYDPNAITNFGKNEVVIPLAVLEELDAMKRFHNDLGRNARVVIRALDALRGSSEGNELHKGVKIKTGASVRIDLKQSSYIDKNFPLKTATLKNQVIMAAYNLSKEKKGVIFVSKDIASRVKAEVLGIHTKDYKLANASYEDIFKQLKQVEIDKKTLDLFLTGNQLEVDASKFCVNEYCILSVKGGSQMVGRFDEKSQALVALESLPDELWGTKPRNMQQRCALDLLLRDEIKLVTLVGPAGTGKTLLALASALRKVFDEGVYGKILVSRPIVPLGKDIGYLPGLKEEKLYHWMQPIYDNLEFLCHSSSDDMTGESLRWITESKKLEMEAVTYIRGRSLPNMFIIIDEAQNLTPHEIKSIISRAGEGTKVVLTGDPSQIDNPYLDEDSNGLTYAISRFGGQKIFGHMLLDRTERSELASLAASIL